MGNTQPYISPASYYIVGLKVMDNPQDCWQGQRQCLATSQMSPLMSHYGIATGRRGHEWSAETPLFRVGVNKSQHHQKC